MDYVLIGTEGPHDQAFLGKILQVFFNLRKFEGQQKPLLEDTFPLWLYFIPKYPRGGNLYSRLNMPSIFYHDTVSVAIWCGSGESSLIKQNRVANNQIIGNLPVDLESWDDVSSLKAFAVVEDADQKTPEEKCEKISESYRDLFPQFPTTPGVVSTSEIKTGCFILPDNRKCGVLESLILECGTLVYPDSLAQCSDLMRSLSECGELNENDLKEFHKPFGIQKATVSAVAAILKPGKTNTVSISDNRWISKQSEDVLKEIIEFLRKIIT